MHLEETGQLLVWKYRSRLKKFLEKMFLGLKSQKYLQSNLFMLAVTEL